MGQMNGTYDVSEWMSLALCSGLPKVQMLHVEFWILPAITKSRTA